RLAYLLLQALTGVAHSLVLVWVGRTEAAHFGGDLSDLLPVDTSDGQPRLFGVDGHVNAGGQRILDGMGIAEAEHHGSLPLHFRAIADTDNFQFPGPALGDSL